MLFPPVLFEEVGEKEWVVEMKAKFNLCHVWGSSEGSIYPAGIDVSCAACQRRTLGLI